MACQEAATLGVEAVTWQGTRRKQLPSNWGQIRKQRLELDGYRCTAVIPTVDPRWFDLARARLASGDTLAAQRDMLTAMRCRERATDVDHTVPGSDHSFANLRSLCSFHHKQKTNQEAIAARALKSQKRPTAKHPGLM